MPNLFSSLQILPRDFIKQVLVLIYHGGVWSLAQPSFLSDSLHEPLLLLLWMGGLWPDIIIFGQSTFLQWSIILAELRSFVVEDEAFIDGNSNSCSLVRAHVSIRDYVIISFLNVLFLLINSHHIPFFH